MKQTELKKECDLLRFKCREMQLLCDSYIEEIKELTEKNKKLVDEINKRDRIS